MLENLEGLEIEIPDSRISFLGPRMPTLAWINASVK